ncbi:uncharacterized [Tachysurus ichikawai]
MKKRSLNAAKEAPKWKKAKRDEASSDEDDESSQRTTSHGGSKICPHERSCLYDEAACRQTRTFRYHVHKDTRSS